MRFQLKVDRDRIDKEREEGDKDLTFKLTEHYANIGHFTTLLHCFFLSLHKLMFQYFLHLVYKTFLSMVHLLDYKERDKANQTVFCLLM